jgi:cephalosporin hydroxylase
VANPFRNFSVLLHAWYRYTRAYFGLRYRLHYARLPAKILAVDGLLTTQEAIFLYRKAKEVRSGCIVEIGSYHGRSTIALALGAQEGEKVPVYAVDPYVAFVGPLGAAFGPGDKVGLVQNLIFTGTVPEVWLIHLPSVQAAKGWQEPIALLWIDGDHTYEGVKADFDAWSSLVIPGGQVAFHDSLDPRLGVHRLIGEITGTGTYKIIEVVEKITLLYKEITKSTASNF